MTLEDLANEAKAQLRNKLSRAIDEWDLGTYAGFNLDQARAVMEFTAAGEVALRARACIVGSVGLASGTWLWSWANDSILPALKEPLEAVRDFGKKHRLGALTKAQWIADEADGWAMTAIAAQLLDADCGYRIPSATGFTFVLLDDFERVGAKSKSSKAKPRGKTKSGSKPGRSSGRLRSRPRSTTRG